MQKHLADYVTELQSCEGLLEQVGDDEVNDQGSMTPLTGHETPAADVNDLSDVFQTYHETAVMRSDEYALICGLLVGVNVVDFNFYLKDENLDTIDSLVLFEPYLRQDSSSQFSEECVWLTLSYLEV